MSTVPKEKKKQSRKPIHELNAQGEYVLVEPLDYLIMEQLQEEGTLMGGYYPLATTIDALFKHFNKDLPKSMLSARLRVLHMQGLTVLVTSASRQKGAWQRTPKGKELVEAWQQKQK